MKPTEAKKRFLQFLKGVGQKIASLEPARGIELMLVFYRDERADGCVLEEECDVLFFQWGEYDEGIFEIDITRQFIEGQAEDEDIRQLSLTFQFELTEPLQQLAEGIRLCHAPEALTEFRGFILDTPAFKLVEHKKPKRVLLELDVAG